MLSRRDFLKLSAAGTAALYASTRARFLRRVGAAQSPQVPLAGAAIPKFVEKLPQLADLGVVDATAGTGPLGTSQIVLNMTEFQAQVLPGTFYAALPAPYNA